MSAADDSNGPTSSVDMTSEVPSSSSPTPSPDKTKTRNHKHGSNGTNESDETDQYKYLVLDSGPIIRLTGLTALRNRAASYLTVPAVLDEIKDAHARRHLQQLPFELKTREPSPRGIQAMVEFARLTGDYASLSSVDIQVLGLLYDLEMEANHGDVDHVRTTPKRTLGIGRIEALQDNSQKEEEDLTNPQESSEDGGGTASNIHATSCYFQGPIPPVGEAPPDTTEPEESATSVEQRATTSAPKTWAMLVNPEALSPASTASPSMEEKEEASTSKVADQALNASFGSMKLSKSGPEDNSYVDGQFSDAEEDSVVASNSDDDDDDDDGYANGDKEISDEECDVYILDPEEVEQSLQAGVTTESSIEDDLGSDFPSLAAAMQVPYEASGEEDDDDETGNEAKTTTPAILAKDQAEMKRAKALEPVSKSGKFYNSFRKYGDIVKPKGITRRRKSYNEEDAYYTSGVETVTPDITTDDEGPYLSTKATTQSRIMGGMTIAGQATQVHDDGEGWITCTSDITKLKSNGGLDPSRSKGNNNDKQQLQFDGPPMCNRAACATTDFAMQNVILQMNLELLSVDGMKVRRLKSWVTRCGACFTVYADGNNDNNVMGMKKRLFCAKCGSDMMQRIAASVDGKTGRLRLHLSKKYKHNLRGTKYSLPKPGTNNRFQGDLLLREDQLLMGAWNQKVKKRSGGKAKSATPSMFGSDIATHVKCHNALGRDDIKVGFGRRNPNAAKGRERRGKKKKSSDKACGLRRY